MSAEKYLGVVVDNCTHSRLPGSAGLRYVVRGHCTRSNSVFLLPVERYAKAGPEY